MRQDDAVRRAPADRRHGDGRDDIASLYKYSVTAPNPVPMAVHIFGTKADGTFAAPFRGWYGTSFPPDSIQLP